jgi:hypothetical protein
MAVAAKALADYICEEHSTAQVEVLLSALTEASAKVAVAKFGHDTLVLASIVRATHVALEKFTAAYLAERGEVGPGSPAA